MINLIELKPFARCLDNWQIKDPTILERLATYSSDYSFINFPDSAKTQNARIGLDISHQRAFLYLVTCTVFDYPHVFTSEKNFKPIAIMRPFILVSSPGSLHNIKKLGFKTFNEYWSEDYDNIQDPTTRLLKIIDILDDICKKPRHELKDMLISMKDILTYNRDFYYNDFLNQEIKKFEIECVKLLGIR